MIFAVPAAEVAFHPHTQNNQHPLFLICDKVRREMAALRKKGVHFGESTEERWGIRTTMELPGGGVIGLYEPKHPGTFGKHGAARKPKRQKP